MKDQELRVHEEAPGLQMTTSPSTSPHRASGVSLLICTRDRAGFLCRALDYYMSCPNEIERIVVADASTEENWSPVLERYRSSDAGRLVLQHSQAGESIPARINGALREIDTDFVFLVADDDIVFADWFRGALGVMRDQPGCAVVFGHTLGFAVGEFCPHGDLEQVQVTTPVPPLHWLGATRWNDRLHELEKSDWTTAGWYALQRTRDLGTITETALQFGLDGYTYERFFIFAQAVMGTTVMTEEVFLARQLNRSENREPFSYRSEAGHLQALEDASTCLLHRLQGVSEEEARRIVRVTYARELAQLRLNDRRRALRILKRRFPRMADIYSRIRGRLPGPPSSDYGDVRLPGKPRRELLFDRIALLSSIAAPTGREAR